MDSTVSTSSGGSRPPQQQPRLPPGFRFHPTDEELVVHYLKRKASSLPLPADIIADVDLYKFDPWQLPGKATFGEQEWYFFSPRDRKYPNGARPNRASTSGYWKATGTDKPILSSGDAGKVGVKKALVFYGGKPPKGIKTDWIMHEYRLPDSSRNTIPHAIMPSANGKKASLRLDDWVLCRIYKKTSSSSSSSSSNCISMHNETAASAEQASMQPLYPQATEAATSRLQQPNPQYQQQRYSSALLDNDHNFLQGFLTQNADYDANTMTCNTAIQLQASAGDGEGGDMIWRSKPEQFQQQLCSVSSTFQAKRALPSLPPYWYDDAAAAGNNIDPQPPPPKRFQVFDNISDGGSNRNNININSISSNNNNDSNVICNTIANRSPSHLAAPHLRIVT